MEKKKRSPFFYVLCCIGGIAAVAVTGLLILIIMFVFGGVDRNKSGMKYYNSEDCAFSTDMLGEYEKVDYTAHDEVASLFTSKGTVLVAEYNDANYEKQMVTVMKYDFLDEPLQNEIDDYLIPAERFTVGSWQFLVMENTPTGNADFPKHFTMIGYSDAYKRIAYLTFSDQDLDYISETESAPHLMSEFVAEYFNYDFS